MKSQTDNGFIREYYKSFFHGEKEDLWNIQASLHPKEFIYSEVAHRSKDIYNLISNHYSATAKAMTQIAETIDSIENSTKCSNAPTFPINPYAPLRSQNPNDSDSDSDEEPISLSKLSFIIKENKATIQRLQSKLIEKENKNPKITTKIASLNDQLKEESKAMNTLIATFDNPSDEDLSNESYSVIVSVVNEIFHQAQNDQPIEGKMNKEEISEFIKEIGRCISQILSEERRAIKKRLLEIKQQMKRSGSFFSHLFELLICEYDIISINDKIKKGNEALIKTQRNIEDIKSQIEKLEVKNKIFDQTKRVLQKRNSNKKTESKEKEAVLIHHEEIDRLKLLIYNMDKDYIELLKQLSLKIVKPKDLVQPNQH